MNHTRNAKSYLLSFRWRLAAQAGCVPRYQLLLASKLQSCSRTVCRLVSVLQAYLPDPISHLKEIQESQKTGKAVKKKTNLATESSLPLHKSVSRDTSLAPCNGIFLPRQERSVLSTLLSRSSTIKGIFLGVLCVDSK